MSMSELTPKPEVVRRIEVFTGTGRRRLWSAEDKAAIVAESHAGESVSAVARRHGLSSQQLFTWRREARKASESVEAAFVPALLSPSTDRRKAAKPRRERRISKLQAAIELEIGGVIVRIADGADVATIRSVIRALKSTS
jgi:transposase